MKVGAFFGMLVCMSEDKRVMKLNEVTKWVSLDKTVMKHQGLNLLISKAKKTPRNQQWKLRISG